LICPNCNSKSIKKIRKVYVTEEKIQTYLCHCNNCDYLYLENQDWLEIAYRNKFYGDTGYVYRNYNLVKKSLILFRIWGLITRKKIPKACDIGAGIGMYARLMRDNGYNFYGSDHYSEMLLIRPFVKDNDNYPIKTSFEVIEHLTSFPDFLKEKIKKVDLFLFSTELRQVGHIPDNSWWYYSFQIGQHIGFHSKKSLKKAFEISGFESKNLISYGSSLHAFANTREWLFSLKLSHLIWKLFSISEKINKIINKIIFKEKSLMLDDYSYIMKSIRKNNQIDN
jgi:hypothetical protein